MIKRGSIRKKSLGQIVEINHVMNEYNSVALKENVADLILMLMFFLSRIFFYDKKSNIFVVIICQKICLEIRLNQFLFRDICE